MSGAPITPPPPIAVVYGGSLSYSPTSSPSPSSSSSVLIVILIIASAIFISALIYFLLRFLSKRFRRPRRTFSAGVVPRNHASSENQNAGQLKCHVASDHDFFDSLPVFTFGSLTAGGGDCAVCLSKFERHDQLRLLPLCCHAFHAACIDAWLVSNRTCPLCRSTVLPSNSAALDKILSSGNNNNISTNSRDGNSGSFRIQIGSISRRGATAETTEQPPRMRSYSVGSFDYNVLDYEVSLDHSTTAIDKELSLEIPAPEVPATEVSGRRNWLREYVDRLTSVSSTHTMTFRNSGRSFTGSIRRSDAVVVPEDLEANRAYGEEISELFRWLTGV